MPQKKVLISLHIAPKVRDDFKISAKKNGKDMSEVAEKLMKTWMEKASVEPGRERIQLDQAVEILARAVSNQLIQNRRWATEAIMEAGMGLPGSDVFDKRTGHFSLEKQECGLQFARWVLLRTMKFLNEGRNVFLVCDSGTTVFWFLKALGEVIKEYFKDPASQMQLVTPDKLANLKLITNNLPGAEAFVTFASQNTVSFSSKEVRISDLVKCRLLAGELLPEYVALTGDDTDNDLDALFHQVIGQKLEPPPVFIGVATGNWLNIESFEGVPLPHLLARGLGHGNFKRKLLDVSDEIFVLAPLGKIFMKSVDVLNKALNYSPDSDDPHVRSYEVVPMPSGKAAAIKLVTTSRGRISSILRHHSVFVGEAIGRVCETSEDQRKQASLPITDVKHLRFDFDRFSDEATETQLEIELPHPETRTKEFKREFFSIIG